MTVTAFFRWYDLWIGAYVDRAAQAVYICPLPMVGLRISWAKPKECSNCGGAGAHTEVCVHHPDVQRRLREPA